MTLLQSTLCVQHCLPFRLGINSNGSTIRIDGGLDGRRTKAIRLTKEFSNHILAEITTIAIGNLEQIDVIRSCRRRLDGSVENDKADLV